MFKEQAFEPIHHVQFQQNLHYKISTMSRVMNALHVRHNYQGSIESL
jgi:hypothetical protein